MAYEDQGRERGSGRGPGGGDRGRRGPHPEGRGVPLSELDPAVTEVSRKLIGAAIEVHKGLGPGFDETVYQKALELELQSLGVPFKSHHPYPVHYRGQQVGTRTADLVVDGRFIVELLAARGEVGGAERAGLRALLRVADFELGLIVNFAERRLKDGLVRVLNPDKLNLRDEESHESGFDENRG